MLTNQGTSVIPDPFRQKETIRVRSGRRASFTDANSAYVERQYQLNRLPAFQETSQKYHNQLLVEKIRQCSSLTNFVDSNTVEFLVDREYKLKTIYEITNFIESNSSIWEEKDLYKLLTNMITSNIFRVIKSPPNTTGPLSEIEENDDCDLDPNWVYMQATYELCIKFLESPKFNSQYARFSMDRMFALQLIDLFSTEYGQERLYLKVILHHLYAKMLNLRVYIRRLLTFCFLRSVYENEQIFGTAELLEVYASIINGFVLPLKEEHLDFLQKVLLPLHKTQLYMTFMIQLTNCLVQILNKDATLLEVIVKKGILKYWPKTCSRKEVLFMTELDECISVVSQDIYEKVQFVVLQQIARSLKSLHFQVAERCLIFISQDDRLRMIESSPNELIPLLYQSLVACRNVFHWNSAIRKVADNIKTHFDNIVRNQPHRQRTVKVTVLASSDEQGCETVSSSTNPLP